MTSGAEATLGSETLKSMVSESDLSDILALPKLKEKSGQKSLVSIRKLFVLQMMPCLIDLKLKTKKRRIKNRKKRSS